MGGFGGDIAYQHAWFLFRRGKKRLLGIPDYPLHAIVGFKQHLKRYGNFNTILSYRDRIEQLLAFYETIQDSRGFISANVGVSRGFVPGWATRRGPDRKGTPAYAQIMLYYNFKTGAYQWLYQGW